MFDLGRNRYCGMGLNVDEVKDIIEKCLLENKYFKVWNMKWKGPGPMPCDWYEGKVAFYNYVESKLKGIIRLLKVKIQLKVYLNIPQIFLMKMSLKKIKRDGQGWWKN